MTLQEINDLIIETDLAWLREDQRADAKAKLLQERKDGVIPEPLDERSDSAGLVQRTDRGGELLLG